MKQNDLKLYFVAIAMEAPDHRILYAVDIRDGIMMLGEKMARGRSGVVPLISEKALQSVSVSASSITFVGTAEEITRKFVAAFVSPKKAAECYDMLDVCLCDSRWAGETAEVLELFATVAGQRCSFGEKVLAA